eukprot:1858649-Prymnesium_polylepis.2
MPQPRARGGEAGVSEPPPSHGAASAPAERPRAAPSAGGVCSVGALRPDARRSAAHSQAAAPADQADRWRDGCYAPGRGAGRVGPHGHRDRAAGGGDPRRVRRLAGGGAAGGAAGAIAYVQRRHIPPARADAYGAT